MESQYFNNLLEFVAQEERYNKELTLAKEEFERFAGPIFVTDRSYDARINSFHNWYILDRPLREQGVTPLQYFVEYNANTLAENELRRYKELDGNLHSLFELVKFGKNKTRVKDLVTGKKYDIDGIEQTQAMDPGLLFNSRIFRHEPAYYFSNYFLLHPSVVSREIRVEAKKTRKRKEDPKQFLFNLVLYQSRYDQYKQMEPWKIYRFNQS